MKKIKKWCIIRYVSEEFGKKTIVISLHTTENAAYQKFRKMKYKSVPGSICTYSIEPNCCYKEGELLS